MLRHRKLQSAAMALALLLLITVALLWSGATIVRRIIVIAGARGGDVQTKTSFVGNHLRGGSGSVVATNTKEDLVWVHSDTQPFVSLSSPFFLYNASFYFIGLEVIFLCTLHNV